MPIKVKFLDVWIFRWKIKSRICLRHKKRLLISLVALTVGPIKIREGLLETFSVLTWNSVISLLWVIGFRGFQKTKILSFCTRLLPICFFDSLNNPKNQIIYLTQIFWLSNCLFWYFFSTIKFPSSANLQLHFSRALLKTFSINRTLAQVTVF